MRIQVLPSGNLVKSKRGWWTPSSSYLERGNIDTISWVIVEICQSERTTRRWTLAETSAIRLTENTSFYFFAVDEVAHTQEKNQPRGIQLRQLRSVIIVVTWNLFHARYSDLCSELVSSRSHVHNVHKFITNVTARIHIANCFDNTRIYPSQFLHI